MDKEKIYENLAHLRTVGDAILSELGYKDTRCWPEYIMDLQDSSYRLTLNERSPTDDKFRQAIADKLQEYGFENVEVTTEW